MIAVAQQLAEKLHAVARTYASGDSSRAKDAFDSILYAQTDRLPSAGDVRAAVRDTFAIRSTSVPPSPPPLPATWRDELHALLEDFPIRGVGDAQALMEGWVRLWAPILDQSTSDSAQWDAATIAWIER